MRLPGALVLGALLTVAQANVVLVRQAPDTTSPPDSSSTPPPTDGGGSSSNPPDPGQDTTVIQTEYITDKGGSAITSTTTVTTSITTTVIITSTDFATTTVTSRDQDTATKTVYETTTAYVNKKRGIDGFIAPRTGGPAAADAVPTAVAYVDWRRNLAERAIITQIKTVTVPGTGGGSTVVETVTKSVVNTKTDKTTTTVMVTETEQANAKTTVSVTSTLTVTSTVVTTGVVETTTSAPTSKPGGGTSGGDESEGMSSGAKIGIGLGAGVGGAAVLGGLAWFLLRRRGRGPKYDNDDLVGASEVPVGGSGPGATSPPMSRHSAAAAGFLAPGRNPSKPAEGYRGTAMGDGRAGFAKPDAYGSSYSPSPVTTMSQSAHPTSPSLMSPGPAVSPGPVEIGAGAHAEATPAAELGTDNGNASKWHNPNASEIDSQPVMSHQSGPVFEMSTQNYR